MQEFSKRVGLEPATDLQRRLEALCEEAGLEVVEARMSLQRMDTMETSFRFIFVYAHEPGWQREVPEDWEGSAFAEQKEYQIEVQAVIPVAGAWPETVVVRCMASDTIVPIGPTLRNTEASLSDLPNLLRDVLRQQREVIAARKRGDRGPWDFNGMRWESVGW